MHSTTDLLGNLRLLYAENANGSNEFVVAKRA